MQWDTLAFLPHPTDITDITDIDPPRPFAAVCFDPLTWSSGSDQRRISGCGIRWLLAGPDSLPLWLRRVCAFVLLRCFSCSHTVLPKEHSLGIIFFSSLSSCKCCIFLQFYLHFTTDYTCMIVYVTNNKEPWTLNLSFTPVQAREGNRVMWQTQWWSSYVFAHKPRLRRSISTSLRPSPWPYLECRHSATVQRPNVNKVRWMTLSGWFTIKHPGEWSTSSLSFSPLLRPVWRIRVYTLILEYDPFNPSL